MARGSRKTLKICTQQMSPLHPPTHPLCAIMEDRDARNGNGFSHTYTHRPTHTHTHSDSHHQQTIHISWYRWHYWVVHLQGRSITAFLILVYGCVWFFILMWKQYKETVGVYFQPWKWLSCTYKSIRCSCVLTLFFHVIPLALSWRLHNMETSLYSAA